MKRIKYWLVEATKQKVYPFFKGKTQVTTNDLNDLAGFRKKLQQENPNDFWDICTSECATIYEDFGVKFINGRFEKL